MSKVNFLKGKKMKKRLFLLLSIAITHCSINANADNSAITIEPLADHPNIINGLFECLYKHMLQKYDPNHDEVKKRYKPFLETHLQKKDVPLGLVALKNGLPIGLCCLRKKPVSTDDKCSWFKNHPDVFPWIAGLFIVPEHRRKGIAKKLILKTIEQAKKLNYEKVYLFTEKSSTEYEIYIKNGCTEFDTAECLTSDTKKQSILLSIMEKKV